MRFSFKMLFLIITTASFGQNIQVDSQTYSPQQLIQDVLIDSNCIENVIVNNVVGGDFGTTDKSFGYFEAAGSSFPFESGIVLSTGRLSNVPGPNDNLSDDNAPNWGGDSDLETILDETNTINATILEFEFSTVASRVSFRYIFASEEYQEGDPNTCNFSDLFGFLIKPIGASQFTNIAIVPDTQTPVKVTTVHPEIPGGCEAQNEAYFESFNTEISPINFNGQTKILTATADIQPNQTYQVKLVIADEQNFRFDSAVFLEAGSFQLSTDIGFNRLQAAGNPVCENDTIVLDATENNANSYKWFRDGIELTTETNAELIVSSSGVYQVEVTLDNNCISYGEVTLEYVANPEAFNAIIVECDQDQDGLTFYNLFDATATVTNDNQNFFITGFFTSELDAITQDDAISEPNFYENTAPAEIVYARVENDFGCFDIAEIELQTSNNSLVIPVFEICEVGTIDGFAEFNLSEISTGIESQIPADASISYFETEMDAFQDTNNLGNLFENTIAYTQTIFIKVESDNQCYAISEVNLEVLYTPLLAPDETVVYCQNNFPETITLFGGVQNDLPNNYYYQWLFDGQATGVTTTFFETNQVGTYSVIVTDPNGCSNTRLIEVTASETAIISELLISQASDNNSITVILETEGDFEFALDNSNGPFQSSNIFTSVRPGFHTVYVRNSDGCGIVERELSVIGFPKFFTPNGDNFNDFWQVYGVSPDNISDLNVQIFDRYGTLLSQFDQNDIGWDGTFNSKPLPSSDYWFVAKFSNGKLYKGHFTLKR